MGFPNAYDRANGRSGQNLMVHGACSSSGCYSMTDESVSEIYAFGRDAFKGGQRDFQVQAFPFRMTAANMARYKNDQNYPFWKMLKQGYDYFEANKVPPKVDVCEKRYVFNVATADGQPLSPTGLARHRSAARPCPMRLTKRPSSRLSAPARRHRHLPFRASPKPSSSPPGAQRAHAARK